MNDTRRLHQAAEMARTIMLRLGSEKGVLEQIASGEWDGGLTGRGAVDDATALPFAIQENVRFVQATRCHGAAPRPKRGN